MNRYTAAPPEPPHDPPGDLADLRTRVLQVVRERGYRRLDEPVRLASGELSRDFIDAKVALARGEDLAIACRAILALAADMGIDFEAVGGLTMGADHFAHGVALLGSRQWFVVRKEPKGRGTDRVLEGAQLGEGTRVLLVDDVVSTGGSIRRAHGAVTAAGAQVVLATTLVDRGDTAKAFFREQGVRYRPLLTYHDFGIEPVGRR